jgi:hypothetical protein
MNADNKYIYKRYQCEDGRTLELTKEEFEGIVEVFRLLVAQDNRLKASKNQLDSSNLSLRQAETDKIIEPVKSLFPGEKRIG